MMDISNLIRLITWASPSFPIGAFSYSHGIEYAVEAGLVSDADGLREWVGSIISDGDGRNDAIMLCYAHRAAVVKDDDTGLRDVMRLSAAMRASSEFALESRQQGEAFFRAVRSVWPSPEFETVERLMDDEGLNLAFPVAFGVTCAVNAITLEPSLAAYLHGFASNLVSAGVRLIPLGQTDGLAVIAGVEADVTSMVEVAIKANLGDLGSATPVIDWTSTQHESQYTRLFRS